MKRRVLSFLLAFSLVAANVSAYSVAPLSAYAGETKEENSGAGDSGTQSEILLTLQNT
ncbi:hypothetical protein QYZ88_018155 [Lachnospiraceae bacterium C1.1]|nr:hypothetical protein [Lachnospiraceae bacterium C1.1]